MVISLIDRIGRPLTRLCTTVLMLVVTWFIIRLGNMTVDAAEVALTRWSHGEQVDWAGLATLVGAMVGLLSVMLPVIVSLFRDRRIERVEEIRAGGGAPQPGGPFGDGRSPPSTPSSPDLDVNDDPTASPRPAENWAQTP